MRTALAILSTAMLLGCNYDACEESGINRIAPLEGAVRIERIYKDLGIHADVAVSSTGAKLPFNRSEFVIKPKVGDSLYKAAGKLEYILVTADGTLIQRWDCDKDKAIIVDSW